MSQALRWLYLPSLTLANHLLLKRTYGFYRIEILASLVNSVVLILLSLYILYEGFRRAFEPPQIESLSIIIVAAVELAVNFMGMRLLGKHSHRPDKGGGDELQSKKDEESLNVRAVYLETFADTIGAAGRHRCGYSYANY